MERRTWAWTRSHRLEDQGRRSAESRVADPPFAPAPKAVRREAQRAVLLRLACHPAVVDAAGLDHALRGGTGGWVERGFGGAYRAAGRCARGQAAGRVGLPPGAPYGRRCTAVRRPRATAIRTDAGITSIGDNRGMESIVKNVKRVPLRQQPGADLMFWLSRPMVERIAAVEALRRQALEPANSADAEPRLQRVCRVAQRQGR